MMKTQLIEVQLQVDQSTINAYAELTADRNPLHTDPAFAATTPMGGVIAHGTLSLNLLWLSLVRTFGEQAISGCELDVRFAKPVRAGQTISAGGQESDTPGLYEVWIRLADGTPAIEGTLAVAQPPAPSGANRTYSRLA